MSSCGRSRSATVVMPSRARARSGSGRARARPPPPPRGRPRRRRRGRRPGRAAPRRAARRSRGAGRPSRAAAEWPHAGPGVDADVVVVAAGGEEAGLVAEVGGLVEAERVAVEGRGGGDVGHVEVDVAHARALGHAGRRALGGAEQVLDVDRVGADAHLVAVADPLVARAVAVDLDAVPVGVAQVDRLADDVVGEAGERDAVLSRVGEPAGEVRARGHEQRVVVEAGVVLHGERAGLLVEHEQVVAPRAEGGHSPPWARAWARGRGRARTSAASARGRRR